MSNLDFKFNSMTPLFKKLNFKDQKEILVLNAPKSFGPELAEMEKVTRINTSPNDVKEIHFAMVFATKQQEVDKFAEVISSNHSGDSIVWFCYPKGTSKNYKCEFNRDKGWQVLGNLGWEPVRMVAIDQDWSALRFRKAEYIKTMTRSFALSKKGKEKTNQTKGDV